MIKFSISGKKRVAKGTVVANYVPMLFSICAICKPSFITMATLADSLDMQASSGSIAVSPAEDESIGVEIMEIYLTVASAMKGKDADLWITAIDKEKVKLLSYEVWGKPLEDAEIRKLRRSGTKILPIVIILDIKRSGVYKARAVVLGNLQDRSTSEQETYAPVISLAAQRYTLISCVVGSGPCEFGGVGGIEESQVGDHLRFFDLTNAFLNAFLEAGTFVRLPKLWQEAYPEDVRELKRALYGLRVSPRAWWLLVRGWLLSVGWEESEHTEGLYRKLSKDGKTYLKLTLYVDDCLLGGKHLEEVEMHMQEILGRFPGKEIKGEPVKLESEGGKEFLYFDVLGCDVYYSRERRELLICSQKYIRKTCAKFGWTKAEKPVLSPSFDEAGIVSSTKIVEEPVAWRSMVGALGWIVSTSRADVAVPHAVLSRYSNVPVNRAMVRAMRKVFQYLLETEWAGIRYSPAHEQEFRELYEPLFVNIKNRPLPDRVFFGDASFANVLKCMRSTSGICLYYRGCLLLWKTLVQSIRAYSTAQSEFVAISDVLIVSETNAFTTFYDPAPVSLIEPTADGFIDPTSEEAIFSDNTAAVQIATSPELKTKSRHYAMRLWRVRDNAEKLVWCPTGMMKADGMTKLAISPAQRRMLFHNVVNTSSKKVDDVEPASEEEEETENVVGYLLLNNEKYAVTFLS